MPLVIPSIILFYFPLETFDPCDDFHKHSPQLPAKYSIPFLPVQNLLHSLQFFIQVQLFISKYFDFHVSKVNFCINLCDDLLMMFQSFLLFFFATSFTIFSSFRISSFRVYDFMSCQCSCLIFFFVSFNNLSWFDLSYVR